MYPEMRTKRICPLEPCHGTDRVQIQQQPRKVELTEGPEEHVRPSGEGCTTRGPSGGTYWLPRPLSCEPTWHVPSAHHGFQMGGPECPFPTRLDSRGQGRCPSSLWSSTLPDLPLTVMVPGPGLQQNFLECISTVSCLVPTWAEKQDISISNSR